MKFTLSHMVGSAILATALVACGGGGKAGKSDMAVAKTDGGSKTDGGGAGDMSGSASCTAYGAWATDQVGAYQQDGATTSMYDYSEGVFGYQAGTGTLADVLEYDYFHVKGDPAPTTPATVTLGGSSTYITCTDCLQVFKDVDPNDSSTGTLFFATEGTINVTARDRGPATGTVAVKGSNIKLVEWDAMADAEVAGGACLTVASFDFSAMFDNSAPDGGADM